MSEYWKSTPKYLCKYCNVYVRDTKLERTNHESTGKHQGALKRFLRDLHRSHDQQEREKERAQREINRLNGLVGNSSQSSGGNSNSAGSSRGAPAPTKGSLEQERKRQVEQLAALGVAVPAALQGDMAMAGEWTVTATRVIPDASAATCKEKTVEAVATGVAKRKVTEEEQEEEEAVSGLFKKRRRWGNDSKVAPSENKDLDALLAGDLFGAAKAEPAIKKEEGTMVKEEESLVVKQGDVAVKKEEDDEESAPKEERVVFKRRRKIVIPKADGQDDVKPAAKSAEDSIAIKSEPADEA
ncbi:hypothetical protein TD95_003898 [Thielaviopsis punctulata]|uniref:U1-type domain-containing protein n=1 Tax=Thielaviopsis punctulata TaxID=72032 RepID=A0A0F4ZB99_9PEZI|nr:hypothetical protein TD95_004826 [Thielaviopsis punctulata]KKA27799.1 hypothetical protein TD95_003898 [Thielaviopsis punctulata]